MTARGYVKIRAEAAGGDVSDLISDMICVRVYGIVNFGNVQCTVIVCRMYRCDLAENDDSSVVLWLLLASMFAVRAMRPREEAIATFTIVFGTCIFSIDDVQLVGF